MSQPPPSYPVPSGYPPGQPPLPTRYRPSGWWFVLGGALVVAAIVAGIGLFVWTLSAFLTTDATVGADGQAHRVSVDTDGDRMLWVQAAVPAPDCEVVDTATGRPVALSPVTSHLTKDVGDGEWRAAYRFAPGSGELEVTCAGAPDVGTGPDRQMTWGPKVQIGPAPSIGGFVGGVLATIAVPSLLGLSGVAILVVTGVLWATRPARPKG
jgi:hypothetical protein